MFDDIELTDFFVYGINGFDCDSTFKSLDDFLNSYLSKINEEESKFRDDVVAIIDAANTTIPIKTVIYFVINKKNISSDNYTTYSKAIEKFIVANATKNKSLVSSGKYLFFIRAGRSGGVCMASKVKK